MNGQLLRFLLQTKATAVILNTNEIQRILRGDASDAVRRQAAPGVLTPQASRPAPLSRGAGVCGVYAVCMKNLAAHASPVKGAGGFGGLRCLYGEPGCSCLPCQGEVGRRPGGVRPPLRRRCDMLRWERQEQAPALRLLLCAGAICCIWGNNPSGLTASSP